jgi:hypothetical protein
MFHKPALYQGTTSQVAEKWGTGGNLRKNLSPGLKRALICWLYAGVETPASLPMEFFPQAVQSCRKGLEEQGV